MLLKSWAMPPASVPMACIFCAWRKLLLQLALFLLRAVPVGHFTRELRVGAGQVARAVVHAPLQLVIGLPEGVFRAQALLARAKHLRRGAQHAHLFRGPLALPLRIVKPDKATPAPLPADGQQQDRLGVEALQQGALTGGYGGNRPDERLAMRQGLSPPVQPLVVVEPQARRWLAGGPTTESQVSCVSSAKGPTSVL
jgi:hypothetical protein